MTMQETIEKELTNRFEKINFQAIILIMKKSGDKIAITPCSESGDIKNMNDVSSFSIESQYVSIYSCDTLSKLAKMLQNYEHIRDYEMRNKKTCYEYYEQHIKGQSIQKLQHGNQYFQTIWNAWYNQDEIKDYWKFEKQYPVMTLRTNTKQTEKYIRNAIALAHKYKYFSDWYKKLYGDTPNLTDKNVL